MTQYRQRMLIHLSSISEVFQDGSDSLISPESRRKRTPVNDHILDFMTTNATPINIEKFEKLFDLFEILLFLKNAATGGPLSICRAI